MNMLIMQCELEKYACKFAFAHKIQYSISICGGGLKKIVW
jgi:hypothetical protein